MIRIAFRKNTLPQTYPSLCIKSSISLSKLPQNFSPGSILPLVWRVVQQAVERGVAKVALMCYAWAMKVRSHRTRGVGGWKGREEWKQGDYASALRSSSTALRYVSLASWLSASPLKKSPGGSVSFNVSKVNGLVGKDPALGWLLSTLRVRSPANFFGKTLMLRYSSTTLKLMGLLRKTWHFGCRQRL